MIENEHPKCCQKCIKVKALGVRGMIFQILIDFGKLVFYMFLDAAQNIFGAKWRVQEGDYRRNHNPDWTTKLRFWPFWLILHTRAGVG